MLEYARQVEPIDIPKGPRPPTRPTWESEDVLSFVPKEMLPNEGQYDASVRDQMIGMEALPWASGRPVEPPFLGMCQVFILTGDVEIQRLRDELADME